MALRDDPAHRRVRVDRERQGDALAIGSPRSGAGRFWLVCARVGSGRWLAVRAINQAIAADGSAVEGIFLEFPSGGWHPAQ